jgi:monofunctional biosynthetic peptidoglycan transglycosylase
MVRRSRRRYRPRRSLRRRIASVSWKLGLAAVLLSVLPTACLRWVDPPTTSFMVQSRLEAHPHRGDRLRQYWVDWEEIATHAKLAVVAAEDQRFLAHRGFDFDEIADAVYERVKHDRQRGASTISQQVAKNLFLWPEKSLLRKGLEAYFTTLIECLWPKRRILEVYLNVAQFGDGVFGVEAASVQYFAKPAARLSRDEAALLAAVLPNPVRYRADRPSSYVRERAREIATQMEHLGGSRYLSRL